MWRFIFLGLCFCGRFAWAQTGKNAVISGNVRDVNGKPIPHAYIKIDSLNMGAAADLNGNYVLKKIPFGTHEVSAGSIGYRKKTRKVVLSSDSVNYLNFILQEDPQQLEEVVVQGKSVSKTVEEQGFAVTSLDTKKFENTSLDVNQVLGQTAGVRIRETGGLGSDFVFFLNGLSGRQVKFFLDGQPLENFGSLFNLNNIPVNLVQRVDIYKGAVPIHLGADALGGAINVVTKQDFVDYLDASYSFGSFNTHRANLSGSWRDNKSGLTAGVQFFYNWSDNNYIMRNVETVSDGAFVTGDFERFHDNFRSYMGHLEAGFTNVNWADRFMVGFGYGSLDKDLQTNSRGSITSQGAITLQVAGEAFQEEENTRFTLRYDKAGLGLKKLKTKAFISYSTLKSTSVDTTSNRYNWRGEISRATNEGGEFSFEKTLFQFDQQMFQANIGLEYELDGAHHFSTNFTWSYVERQGENIFRVPESNPFQEPNTLDKKVLGLAYRLTAFDKKLQTTLSGKYFGLGILAREARQFQSGEFTIEDLVTDKGYIGYGLAARYFLNDQITFKTSYERAYRIPEAFEIFGDGLLIIANPEIKPESSHNVNLGTLVDTKIGEEGNMRVEVHGFLRLVDDMIFPSQGGRFISYENVQKILVRGVEADVRYDWKGRFQMGINATYQDVLNNVEFIPGIRQRNIVYRERMYNTPYFFANADISYGIANIGTRNVKLSAYYNANYVHEFFLNYPSIAQGGDKFTIPTQFLHHAGITVGSDNDRYNLGVEVRNITNERAFDNFALQKPGRAFFVKLRYFLTR